MSDSPFFTRAYATKNQNQIGDLYADWAESYDADVMRAGYRTPVRLASAVSALADKSLPLLDYGCGTGMSGVALSATGFSRIEGCDPSPEMLAKARMRDLYDRLWSFDPATPPSAADLRIYGTIVATGVISVGAAPPGTLDMLWAGTASGARLAFSYNDHTLGDADYMAHLATVQNDRSCETEFEGDGPHIESLGSISRIFVLRRK